MIVKGILIDPHTHFKIERECSYDTQRIDGMYVKVDGKDLIPIAYIYPLEHKAAIEALLKELRDAKKAFEDVQSRIFYREFPKFREVKYAND